MAVKTNVNKNGNKYFRITKTVSHKVDGTPIKKEFYGSCKSDAEEKANEYINKLKNGLVTDFEYAIVSELMQSWLFDFLHNSSKIKPSTFQRYEGIYRNYIKDSEIAGIKVHTITTMHVQKFYNELSKTNHSYTQINTLNTILKVFFNWCIDNGYLLKNPCLKTNIKGNKSELIKKNRQEVEILTEKEIKTIKEHIEGTKYELLILLDMATGLRQGELLALNWDDIDLDKKNLTVNKNVKEVYVYDDEFHKHIETITQTPKTITSFRTIPIPDKLIDKLNNIKFKNGTLFLNELGQSLRAKNVSYQWRKILKECNIPHKKFHSIRHTYASMLLKNGVDIETVAELMGHSAISITQIYLHSSSKQKQTAVNKINYLF